MGTLGLRAGFLAQRGAEHNRTFQEGRRLWCFRCLPTSPPAARVAKSLQLHTFPQFLIFLEGDRRPAPLSVNNLDALGSRTCHFPDPCPECPWTWHCFPRLPSRAPFVVLYIDGVGDHPSTSLLTVSHPNPLRELNICGKQLGSSDSIGAASL